MKSLLASFNTWLHAPAPAERLAAARIAIGGFVTVYLLVNVREFDRLATRDTSAFDPIGIARLLDAPLSPTGIWLLFAALVASGSAFTVGVATRLSGPIFAILVLGWTTYHSSWGQLLHFEHLFTIHLLILAVAPTAEVWAPRSGSTVEPSVRFGWPLRLLAIATAVTYLLSGIAKLRLAGFEWFDPATLANHIGYSATRMETIGARPPILARPVLQTQWLLPAAAAGALVIELGAPFALVGPKLRNVWVVAALMFHASTALTMNVFFGYRGLGFAMLPLFHLEDLPRRFLDLVRRSR